jgi:DNA polymerase elongation subunit (family B)
VSHDKIGPWWFGPNATPGSRRTVLAYNLRDAQLSWYIPDKLSYFYTTSELARLTGVAFETIFKNGQGIRMTSMLARFHRGKRLIPSFTSEEKLGFFRYYEGAVVFNPHRGYYVRPLATKDFASLYPSEIITHNMGYTARIREAFYNRQACKARQTIVLREDAAPAWLIDLRNRDMLEITPEGALFVKKEVIEADMPVILNEVLRYRGIVKKELAKETDPDRAAILDGRQNSSKIVANSGYGATGNKVGQMPAYDIAEGTTSWGRFDILLTRTTVEEILPLDDHQFVFVDLCDRKQEHGWSYIDACMAQKSLPPALQIHIDAYRGSARDRYRRNAPKFAALLEKAAGDMDRLLTLIREAMMTGEFRPVTIYGDTVYCCCRRRRCSLVDRIV